MHGGGNHRKEHFTLNKMIKGNDHYHAMDPGDIRGILRAVEHVDALLGSGELKCLPSEYPARNYARRSIVALRDIKKGETIRMEMLTWKRPGTGIPVDQIDQIIGRCASDNIGADEMIHMEQLQ